MSGTADDLPSWRYRLRRFLLPQGCARAGNVRAKFGAGATSPCGYSRGQREAAPKRSSTCWRRIRVAPCQAFVLPFSVSRSNPIPTISAKSPGLRIAAELTRRGASVIGHDPIVSQAVLHRDGLTAPAVAPSLAAAITGADAAIIATSWAEYREADWPNLAKRMRHPLVLDGRQVIAPAQRGCNFVYAATGTSHSIGADGE